jgi:uncharacterized protein YbjT (DUF2867 family)
MDIAIIGGGGKVGSGTARRLIAGGHRVRVIGRSAATPPDDLKSHFMQGDLANPDSLADGLAGASALFLITPFIEPETALGLAAVTAAQAAGVPKIVYLAIMNLEAMAGIPHFANKIPIKQAVLASGPRAVVLQPNFFFQNDALFLPAIRFGGVYPLPIGSAGVDAIDADDIAEVAARALASEDLAGQVVPLSGPERLTGPAMAATYAELLGRPVSYGGDDLAQFGAMLRQAMPGADDWLVNDLTLMCRETQRLGNHASDSERALLEQLLGRPPRRHRDFAAALLAQD